MTQDDLIHHDRVDAMTKDTMVHDPIQHAKADHFLGDDTVQNSVDDEFEKRRAQKNKLTLLLVFGAVALIWGITMLKMKLGG